MRGRQRHWRGNGETGASLIEAAAAVAIMGIIGVAFLSALATSTTARVIADERISARILAESQVEDIKSKAYEATGNYTLVGTLDEYPGYAVTVSTDNVAFGRTGFQKVTVQVQHHDKEVTTLESYRLKR